MNELAYRTAIGNLKNFDSNNNVYSHNYGDIVMTIFLYGRPIDAGTGKSVLSTCRDMIATFTLTVSYPYGSSNNIDLHEAEYFVKNNVKNADNKIIVLVNVALFDDVDKNAEDLKQLVLCFYNMISTEVKCNFGWFDDIVIVWNNRYVTYNYNLFDDIFKSEDLNLVCIRDNDITAIYQAK